MNTPPKSPKANSRNFRSSISVSDKEVCEDEACIGKAVDSAATTLEETVQPDESSKKPSGTSMSVGGKETCAEDACIGKK
jgi:hypothetical protein